MKICRKCGTELENNATSCISCGYHMDTPQRTKISKAAKWLLIVFNMVMVCWVLVAMGLFGWADSGLQGQALPQGTEDSKSMGVIMIVMIWAICNAVLGVLVWDSRAKKKALQESNKHLDE